jgi:hypothetical protein
VAVFPVPALVHSKPHHHHRARAHHARPFTISDLHPLEACIVYHESTDNRYASNGNDYSYYQWLPSTFDEAARMAHELERANPEEADLYEQTMAFRAYEPTDPTAWETMPDCGGP